MMWTLKVPLLSPTIVKWGGKEMEKCKMHDVVQSLDLKPCPDLCKQECEYACDNDAIAG